MKSPQRQVPCIGCGAPVLDLEDDGNHPGTSPGCYLLFSEVLGLEYSDFRYTAVHNLTVDAYSLQHIGPPNPRTIKSVSVHLISLYLQLERGYDSLQAAHAKRTAAGLHAQFTWMEPPDARGGITILDVHAAPDPAAHREIVSRWAQEVWEAWEGHHPTIRAWADLAGLLQPPE